MWFAARRPAQLRCLSWSMRSVDVPLLSSDQIAIAIARPSELSPLCTDRPLAVQCRPPVIVAVIEADNYLRPVLVL